MEFSRLPWYHNHFWILFVVPFRYFVFGQWMDRWYHIICIPRGNDWWLRTTTTRKKSDDTCLYLNEVKFGWWNYKNHVFVFIEKKEHEWHFFLFVIPFWLLRASQKDKENVIYGTNALHLFHFSFCVYVLEETTWWRSPFCDVKRKQEEKNNSVTKVGTNHSKWQM